MKKKFLLFFIFLPLFSFASSFVAGELTFSCVGLNQYQFNISESTLGQVYTADSVFFDFGDGSGLNYLGLPATFYQISSSGYYTSIWTPIHTYSGSSGPGGYPLLAYFLNRVGGINNIPNSSNVRAIISGNISIDPIIGNNSSPSFNDYTLINQITVGQNFLNSPGPMDGDGDSLSFSFYCSSDSSGCISGYAFPDIAGGGTMGINASTADYYWTSPQTPGAYNIVIRTDEWKLFPNGPAVHIGFVEREIQFNTQQIIGVGIEKQNQNSFSCFPNPAISGEKIRFEIPVEGNYTMEIYNSMGEIVYRENSWMEKSSEIILPELSVGHYNIILTKESSLSIVSDFLIIKK
jgi:hypothetical protein